MRNDRRKFLSYLAASPVWASGLIGAARGSPSLAQPNEFYKAIQPGTISSPADALNVFDFEEAARATLPPAHFGYIATGVDGDLTLREIARPSSGCSCAFGA